jgi:hypothetical protein
MTLKQDLTGDLPIFFNADEFATAAIYDGYIESAGGRTAVSVAINVIFDDPFEAVSPLTGEVELTKPQAATPASNIPDGAHGETLTINGMVYKIIGIQPDGAGQVILILSKDSE